MNTEQDHLRSLADHVGQAHSFALLKHRPKFMIAIQQSVRDATALGFYRNQSQWNSIAILLDECTKRTIMREDWAPIAQMLASLREKIQILANRGVH